MAGFGRILGNLARGVAAGAGQYYGHVATEQAEERRQQGALLRAQALARFQQGIRNEDADIDAKRDIVSAEAQTPVLVDRERQTLAAREPYRVAERQATVQAQTSNREDQQSHDVAMENLRSQHQVSRAVETETRLLERQARERGEEVAHWQVDAQGFLQGFNARGEVITQSRTARFTPPGRSNDGEPSRLPSRAAAPSPPPPARRAAPAGRDSRRIRYDAQGRRIG